MNWHDYFLYDPETGNLIWRERCDVPPGWNTKHAWRVAGVRVTRPDGRRSCVQVYFNNKPHRAHRIVMEMHDIHIPGRYLPDHIDGDPWNNKLDNLRVATRSQNSFNTPIRRDNTSGRKGVLWCNKTQKWRSQITANGRRWSLGEFDTKEEAIKCREVAEKILHGEYRHTTTSEATYSRTSSVTSG